MKKIVLVSLMIMIFSFANRAERGNAGKPNVIVVEIDFGQGRQIKRVEIASNKTITALAALQKAAEVKTHPVGGYVFVTEIDNVAGERGKMAWYYNLNGKKPRLAIEQPVSPGDVISWRFVEDVCSKTVDGPLK